VKKPFVIKKGVRVAPSGFIARLTFDAPALAKFRERCRLASCAERAARDDVTRARYTESGRLRPTSSRIVKLALAHYRAARSALDKLQAACRHPSRSIHSPVHCDICKKEVGVLS
jgi:hypothetical protein